MLPLYLDTKTLAARLGTTVAALKMRRARGEGPPYIKIGARTVRYSVAAVEAWLAERAKSTAKCA